jgi:hypothetical protein
MDNLNDINLTQLKLKAMNGGVFQQFAESFLREDYDDIETLTDYGAVEGTGKTRIGQPDIYFKTIDCAYAVEVTTSQSGRKLIEDTEEAIEFLQKIKFSKKSVILFLNFEPNPEKIEECRVLCSDNNIEFKSYTNSDISYKLDYEFLDLRYDWLKIPLYSPQFLEIFSHNTASQQIYRTLSKIPMVKENQLQDFNNLVNELYMNAIEHGNAHHFTLSYNHSKLIISEDGMEFNFINEVENFNGDYPRNRRGGTQTLKEFTSKYPDFKITYNRKNEKNIYSIFPKESQSINISKECEIQISSINYDWLGNPNTYLNICDSCASILIYVNKWDFFRSRRNKLNLILLQTVQHENYKNQNFIIFIPSQNVPDDFKEELNELSQYEILKDKIFIIEGND